MRGLLPTDGSEPLVEFGEVAEPAPAPDEIVIGVEAFSINRGGTFLLERPRPGWRPGKDIAGRVVRAAAVGRGPAVGERVVGHPAGAGWAEFAAVGTSSLAVLPGPVSPTVATALPLAGLTALRLLRASGPLAGLRVLVTGASGGVGHYVTELAAAAGAAVTVLTGSPGRAERLLSLGALAALRDIQEVRALDVVFESVGGESLSGALRLLMPHGKLIWFGQVSCKPVELDFFSHFAQTGGTIRHFSYEDSEIPDDVDLETLVRLVATDRSHPELGVIRRLVANRGHDRGPARATDPGKRRADDSHRTHTANHRQLARSTR